MKTILVTGGAGFIGSHTCLTLLENNFRVIIIDSFQNSSLIALNKVKFLLKRKITNIEEKIKIFKGDLCNSNFVNQVFKKIHDYENLSAVIHFAGLKSVSESVDNPLNYWRSNVSGTINLLKTMESFNCNNIIFSSSATIYSNTEKPPFKENSPIGPMNPYGNTKLTVEKILEDIFNSFPNKWRICNLRYFNPIGAHPSGLIGENPVGKPNNIFPLLLDVASSKLGKFKVFGKDWDTPDGTCIRDYIHVMDLADGHMSSLNYLLRSPPQLIKINLGTGKGTSVIELIKTFEKENNLKIPYIFSERRRGDIPIIVADNKKAIEVLNWMPRLNLNDMCKDGWKWKCQNPKGYNELEKA